MGVMDKCYRDGIKIQQGFFFFFNRQITTGDFKHEKILEMSLKG